MKPIAGTMVGYIVEEPAIADHGFLIGEKETFLLRVFYPMKKEGMARDVTGSLKARTRAFPFVLHPSIAEEVFKKRPWKGHFVIVTYYLEVIMKNSEYRIVLYATNVERLLDDFPEARLTQDILWLDSNKIEEEIFDVEI